jgi:hypothetical protein
MDQPQHPGYPGYCQAVKMYAGWRAGLAAWRIAGKPVVVSRWGLSWTPESARQLVEALSLMFQAYNRVLWEQYAYCPGCLGQCCRAHAEHVGQLDLAALALLGLPLPDVTGSHPARRQCFYLAPTGCAWPERWRPVKCWAFYCLGPGGWELADPADQNYGAITASLESLVRQLFPPALLPGALSSGEHPADHLGNPLEFAERLENVFWDCFGEDFSTQYLSAPPVPRPDQPAYLLVDESAGNPDAAVLALRLVAETTGWIEARSGQEAGELQVEQVLTDLESLDWAARAGPASASAALKALEQRYAGALPPQEGQAPSLPYRLYRLLVDMRQQR